MPQDLSRLYLVRHAHARWEEDEARPLSSQGRRDATRVAALLESSSPVCIYSSPARRAIETVQPLADRKGLAVVCLGDLRERELPEQAPQEFEAAVRASWERPGVGVGGGEPNHVAQARGLRALRTMLSQHPRGILVAATHGNLLALLLNGLDSTFGYELWRGMTLPDVFELAFQDGKLSRVRRVWRDGDNEEQE